MTPSLAPVATQTLRAQVLVTLRRAHPRPLSAGVVTWLMQRDGHSTNARAVGRGLGSLLRAGRVRRVAGPYGDNAYRLVCPACGGDLGTGGTCPWCGS